MWANFCVIDSTAVFLSVPFQRSAGSVEDDAGFIAKGAEPMILLLAPSE